MGNQMQKLVGIEVSVHVQVRFKDNPGKKLKRHDHSESHKEAVVTITIYRALNKADQYLEKCPKNAAYDSSDSYDALLNSLNLHLKEKSIRTLMEANDIVIFVDEATSLARKEMMGLFVSTHDEKNKRVVVEFVSIATVSSTQSAILMNKVRNILSDNNIDISKTRFSCLDGTNTMSGEHTGLQRRIRHFAPFSIYINCRCHRFSTIAERIAIF